MGRCRRGGVNPGTDADVAQAWKQSTTAKITWSSPRMRMGVGISYVRTATTFLQQQRSYKSMKTRHAVRK